MMMTSPFQQQFERYALISLEKQHKMNSLIVDQTHEIDLDAGILRFAGHDIPMQVLGTESDNTFTWLWAWAEEQTEIPEQLIDASLQLRSWGAEFKISEFLSPSQDINVVDGFAISLIASQICNASCHFRDVYEGGSAYLLLFDRTIDSQPGFDRAGLVQALADLFSRYDMHQRHVLQSYVNLKKLPAAETERVLSVELETRERLVVEFDDHNGIVMINGASFTLQD